MQEAILMQGDVKELVAKVATLESYVVYTEEEEEEAAEEKGRADEPQSGRTREMKEKYTEGRARKEEQKEKKRKEREDTTVHKAASKAEPVPLAGKISACEKSTAKEDRKGQED